jgi:hypothetical protein
MGSGPGGGRVSGDTVVSMNDAGTAGAGAGGWTGAISEETTGTFIW